MELVLLPTLLVHWEVKSHQAPFQDRVRSVHLSMTLSTKSYRATCAKLFFFFWLLAKVAKAPLAKVAKVAKAPEPWPTAPAATL